MPKVLGGVMGGKMIEGFVSFVFVGEIANVLCVLIACQLVP